MPSSLITLDEFWTLTDTDLSVEGFMDKYLIPVSTKVQTWCDKDFGVQSITGERRLSPVTLDGDLRVDFIVKPVVAVTSIDLVFGSSSSDLSLTNADLFRPEGYMLVPLGNVQACQSRILQAGVGVGYLTLGDEYITESTYSGGATVPLDVKQAVALLAWEDYLVKQSTKDSGNPSGGVVESYSIGRYSETYGKIAEGSVQTPGTLGWGTALGQQAEELLIPYQHKGVMFLGVM